MPGKCEHGLTTRECFVCMSPKFGAPAEPANMSGKPRDYVIETLRSFRARGHHHDTPRGRGDMEVAMAAVDAYCAAQVEAEREQWRRAVAEMAQEANRKFPADGTVAHWLQSLVAKRMG